jgi:predicted Ser/Thr protein kinase/tetratricopeptide (TPR) repeat protein
VSDTPLRETTGGGEVTVGGDTDAGASRTFVAARGPATGDVIGRYVVLDVVGHGGMGVVLAAYDPQLDRKVALKLVRPDRAADRGEIEREARMIARLRHPNLVTVHDVGSTEAGVFLAMEFIDGVTLREWQRSDRTWREIVDVYVQAARGLAAAHEAGVVHGDFKPENVFIGSLGGRSDVKLLDFGLARAAGSHDVPELPSASPKSWIPAGTLAYMSPERLSGAAATPAGDQFAFCVALFEALTGTRPYDLETLSRSPPVKATPTWRPRVDVPPWLRTLAQRGLALDAGARWSSMQDLANALERGPGRARRRGIALGVAAAAAAGVLLVATRPDPCADADAEVRAAWSSDLAGRVSGDSVYAELVERVDHRAREYVAELSAATKRSCAMRRRGDLLLEARRTRCIDRGLTTLSVWTEALHGSDESASRTVLVDAVGWEASFSCDDDAALLHEPEPPSDVDRDAARDAMVRLTRATLSRYTMAYAENDAQLEVLVGDLRELGDPALLAEGLYRRGQIATRGGALEQGYDLLLDALSSAEAAGATRLQVQIWRTIADNRNADPGGEGLQELAIERAAAATARLGDPPDLATAMHLSRGALASRRRQHADAETELLRTIEIAEQADLTRPAISARLALVITQLQLHRIDDAVATGDRVVADALQVYGDDHPDTAIALGAHAAALSAAERFDEARTSSARALALLEGWGRYGVSAATGIACNWCNGVARVCRADDTRVACMDCIERVLRTDAPTRPALGGLAVGMDALRLVAPDVAIAPARRIVERADRAPSWTPARAIAALTLLRDDPTTALRIANELCPTPDASCDETVLMLIAEIEPDTVRRSAAADASLVFWREASDDAKSRSLTLGLQLARAGKIDRTDLASAVAAADAPCDRERDAAQAWLAGSK